MDWKRIMNKRPGKAGKNRAEAEQPSLMDRTAEEEIREFFTGLIPEMNLRLLLDMKTEAADDSFPERLLWVESITLTDYEPASAIQSPPVLEVIQPWKRLIGMLNRQCSFKK